MSSWPIEPIPDPDRLFLRVLAQYVVASKVQPGAFRAHVTGTSTEWEKYATPRETRSRAQSKPPSHYGVCFVIAGRVRTIPGLTVEHTPTERNRAHATIFGTLPAPDVDLTTVREVLAAAAPLLIHPNEPVR
jgi:hypothetical protein